MRRSEAARPLLILAVVVAILIAAAAASGTALRANTLFSVMQYFATLGPVALGLGITMVAGEFDLSVGSTLGLAGCVAVLTGGSNPILGLVCGVAIGLVVGLVQGTIMVVLRMSSIPVTLGGLLTVGGLSYVVTDNQTISYPDLAMAMAVNAPLLGVLSVRSLIALGGFAVAAGVLVFTRFGRDLAATGSDRRAAATAGVRTARVVILAFMASGGLAAFAGVLLSYSLAAASPAGLTDTLVPATAAAIIGGVSLSGGRGHVLGIAAGVLTLCVLSACLNAIGASPLVQQVAIGGVLLAVAILDAPLLAQRLRRVL